MREPASTTGDRPKVHLLAAADPANPYGAAVPWPRRGEDDRRPFQRSAGAFVVLVDGLAALYLDRGGSSLQTLPPFDDPTLATLAVGALRGLLAEGRVRELVVSRVDGEPVARSPWYHTLLKAGFIQGYIHAPTVIGDKNFNFDSRGFFPYGFNASCKMTSTAIAQIVSVN